MEAYRIGVVIAMSGNTAQFLSAMSHQLLGVHAKVKQVQRDMSAWKNVIGGAAAAVAGIGFLKATKAVVEHGARLKHFENQAKAAGYTVAKQGEMMAAAWDNAGKNINASASEGYKSILEIAQATGDVGEAMKLLPAFTRTKVAMSNLKDEELKHKIGGDKQVMDFARAMELLGVTTDPHKLEQYTNELTKMMIGMRGMVDGSKLYQGVQNAGAARYGWGLNFVRDTLGPLLMESPRMGTGLFQLERSLGAGRVTEQMARAMEKYGLAKKADELRSEDKNKSFRGLKPGTGFMDDLRRTDPYAWAGKVIDLLGSKGVNTKDSIALQKVLQEIAGSNKNLQMIFDALMLPGPRSMLDKEGVRIRNTPDDAAAQLGGDKDWFKAVEAFHTQWKNLMEALGSPLVDTAVSALGSITHAIQSMASTLGQHPQLAGAISGTAGILGGLATLYGGFKLIKGLGTIAGLWGGGSQIASAAALTGSAGALTGAAGALSAAATKLGLGSAIPAAAAPVAAAAGGGGFLASLLAGAKGLGANLGLAMMAGLAFNTPNFAGVDENDPRAIDALHRARKIAEYKKKMEAQEFARSQADRLKLTGGGKGPAEGVISSITGAASQVADAGKNLMSGFAAAIGSAAGQITAAATSSMTGFIGALSSAGAQAEAVAAGIAQRIQAVLSFTATPKIQMPNIPNGISPGVGWGQKSGRNMHVPSRGSSAPTSIANHIHVDGRKIASITTRHQFDSSYGPAMGANFVDGTLTYPQVG